MQHNSWSKDRNLLSEAYSQINEWAGPQQVVNDIVEYCRKNGIIPADDESNLTEIIDGAGKGSLHTWLRNHYPGNLVADIKRGLGGEAVSENEEGTDKKYELPSLKKGQQVYVTFNDGSELEGKINFDGTDIGNSNAFTLDGGEKHNVDEVVSIDPVEEGEESDLDAGGELIENEPGSIPNHWDNKTKTKTGGGDEFEKAKQNMSNAWDHWKEGLRKHEINSAAADFKKQISDWVEHHIV